MKSASEVGESHAKRTLKQPHLLLTMSGFLLPTCVHVPMYNASFSVLIGASLDCNTTSQACFTCLPGLLRPVAKVCKKESGTSQMRPTVHKSLENVELVDKKRCRNKISNLNTAM